MIRELLIDKLKGNDTKLNIGVLMTIYDSVNKLISAIEEADKKTGEQLRLVIEGTLISFCGNRVNIDPKLYKIHRMLGEAVKMSTPKEVGNSDYRQICKGLDGAFSSIALPLSVIEEYDGWTTKALINSLFIAWYYALRDFNFNSAGADILDDYEENLECNINDFKLVKDGHKCINILDKGFLNYIDGKDRYISVGAIIENPNKDLRLTVNTVYIRAYDANGHLVGRHQEKLNIIECNDKFNFGTTIKVDNMVTRITLRVNNTGTLASDEVLHFNKLFNTKVEFINKLLKPKSLHLDIKNNDNIFSGKARIYGVFLNKSNRVAGGFSHDTDKFNYKDMTMDLPYPFKKPSHNSINISYNYEVTEYLKDVAKKYNIELNTNEESHDEPKDDGNEALVNDLEAEKNEEKAEMMTNMAQAFVNKKKE